MEHEDMEHGMSEGGVGLSESQVAAVLADAPLVIVSAGAGTGKTTTLTHRAGRLVSMAREEGRRVLAVTFTVAAAREMRTRLAAMGFDDRSVLEIRTLHSLAYAISVNAEGFPKGSEWLLSQAEQLEWIEGILPELGDVPLPPGHRAAEESLQAALCRLFQRWSESGLSAEEVDATHRGVFRPEVVSGYGRFLAWKRTDKRADFPDLITMAVDLIDSGVAPRQFVDWAHVLVDEAQDLNQAQVVFLRALVRAADSLTLVGDDDQCLYGFRGSRANFLQDAVREFAALAEKGHVRVHLEENRRCPDEVLVPAVRLVNFNRRERPKVLSSSRAGRPPEAWSLEDERDEARFVRWRIAALLEGGALPRDISVLARTGASLRSLEAELVAARIPHVLRKGTGLIESLHVRDVLAWLTVATHPDATEAFLRIHDRPARGVGRTTALRVADHADRHGLTVREALEQVMPGNRAALDFSDVILSLEDAVRDAASASEALEEVLRLSSYASWTGIQDREGFRDDMEMLRAIAESSTDIDDFLISVSCGRDHDLASKDGEVVLSTIHAAKGLEWDHVFIVGAHAQALPHAISCQEFDIASSNWPVALVKGEAWLTIGRGGMEEERRLLHVGLTRAKQSVVVSLPSATWRRGRRIKLEPSPFLHEAGIEVRPVTMEMREAMGVSRSSLRRPSRDSGRSSAAFAPLAANQPSLF
jgi:superfamily I DNA/RNA helicase